MSFYSERSPIPKQTVHTVREDGTLGEEIRDERIVRDSIVREVEIGVILDYAAAQSLLEWLTGKLDQLERLSANRSDIAADTEKLH